MHDCCPRRRSWLEYVVFRCWNSRLVLHVLFGMFCFFYGFAGFGCFEDIFPTTSMQNIEDALSTASGRGSFHDTALPSNFSQQGSQRPFLPIVAVFSKSYSRSCVDFKEVAHTYIAHTFHNPFFGPWRIHRVARETFSDSRTRG